MTGLASTVANYIRDTYLGMSTEKWLEKATDNEAKSRQRWQAKFTSPHANRVQGTAPSIDKAAMMGDYNDPLYGAISITEEANGSMSINFKDAAALKANLSHWHYDTWQIDWDEEHAWFNFGTVQFLLDNDRKVNGLQFQVPNDDIFFEEIHMMKVNKM